MRPDDPIPSAPEILTQLERILKSEVFVSRRMPGAILKFAVEQALAGKDVHARDIANKLYPSNDYAPGTGAARTNANYMRDLVAEYNNKGDHPEDEVIIEFPEGSKGPKSANYKPSFRYNPNRTEYRRFDEFLLATRQAFPVGIINATHDLAFQLGLYTPQSPPPSQGNLHAKMAFAECNLLLYTFNPSPFHLDWTETITNYLLKESPEHWRSHVIRAMLALA